MTDKRTWIPGPDHPITIERNPARVVVMFAGRVIADTREAITLREASYAPVHYVPRKDVDMTALVRSAHATYCPYKGDCACTTASRSAGRDQLTQCGPTRCPIPPSRRYGSALRFIRNASISARSG